MADNNLSYAVSFNYQVFYDSDKPIPASTRTPTFDSQLGIKVDTATILVIPEVPEHSFYEISCIGMDSVTSKFNKYDLS